LRTAPLFRACTVLAVASASLLAVVSTTLPAWADVPITAVPPADYRAPAALRAAPARMALTAALPARRVVLPEPSPGERAALRARNASHVARNGRMTRSSLAVGFPRIVPADMQVQPLASLPWVTLADGVRAAKVDVVSPGAAAVRVALELHEAVAGMTLRFTGNGERAEPFGPVTAADVAADTARFGMSWSPVLDGDAATIEIRIEADAAIPDASLAIARVSHQVVAPGALRTLDPRTVQDIGLAASCEIDVACVAPQSAAFTNAAKATVEIEFTQQDGFTYRCTATLLNDSAASNTPYIFTASHCMNSALAARTLDAYWFFDAVQCGSRAVPPYVQQTGGAALLARSPDWDWALVRLNTPPPAGVRFSAWRAEPIPPFTPVTVFHHPKADLKKWTAGTTLGHAFYSDGSSFALVSNDEGITEPGSSGAGLLTFFASGGYYELRGGLWTGASFCRTPAGPDQYSRLDDMLPLTREYLTPGSPLPAGLAVTVEYYSRALDHYFITSIPREITGLDNGEHPGWERTGLRFLAYTGPGPGIFPVCRFYRTPGAGDSHFYSAIKAECDAILANPALSAGWILESGNVFYIRQPDPVTGQCAQGTRPIWRFYNQRTINHRYTTEQEVRDAMRADPLTWQPEGYPPDNITMCAPVGS
jgi:hypothetical protein